jgi:hypothetical protein
LFLCYLFHAILQPLKKPDGRMWWKDSWNNAHNLNMITQRSLETGMSSAPCAVLLIGLYIFPKYSCRPRLNPRPVLVGFVVYKWQWNNFACSTSAFPYQCYSTNASTFHLLTANIM